MNKFIILSIFCVIYFSAYSQDDKPEPKVYKNEIATDIAPFITQFISGNDFGPTSPSPYSFLYRRHIKKWAIRLGIGGYGSNVEDIQNDSLVRSSKQSQFDFKIGIERKEDFAKKWQFFYGIDLYSSSRVYSSDDYNKNSGDKTIHDSQRAYVGVSPFFGFRFKLNQRLSLTTAVNMQFYGYKSTEKRIYLPDSSFDLVTESTGSGSNFNTPRSVFVTFNF